MLLVVRRIDIKKHKFYGYNGSHEGSGHQICNRSPRRFTYYGFRSRYRRKPNNRRRFLGYKNMPMAKLVRKWLRRCINMLATGIILRNIQFKKKYINYWKICYSAIRFPPPLYICCTFLLPGINRRIHSFRDIKNRRLKRQMAVANNIGPLLLTPTLYAFGTLFKNEISQYLGK